MFTWLSWELQSGPFMAASSWLVHGWFVASGYSKRKHSHHQHCGVRQEKRRHDQSRPTSGSSPGPRLSRIFGSTLSIWCTPESRTRTYFVLLHQGNLPAWFSKLRMANIIQFSGRGKMVTGTLYYLCPLEETSLSKTRQSTTWGKTFLSFVLDCDNIMIVTTLEITKDMLGTNKRVTEQVGTKGKQIYPQENIWNNLIWQPLHPGQRPF